MQKFKTYLLNKLDEQLDIIENSSQGNLTEYQAGYISALNFLIDLIMSYKDNISGENKTTKYQEKTVIKPGFRPFQKREKKTTNESNENRRSRFTWTGKK